MITIDPFLNFFEIRGGVDDPPNNQRMLPNFLSESGPPSTLQGGLFVFHAGANFNGGGGGQEMLKKC